MKCCLLQRGFSLIEMLVVTAMISVLVLVIIVNYSESRETARKDQAAIELEQMRVVMRLYLERFGHYPEGDHTDGIYDNFHDNCSKCFYHNGDPDSAAREWNVAADAMFSAGLTDVPLYTDPWGRAYGYDNNLPPTPNTTYWTAICSLGADGVMQTFTAANSANYARTVDDPQAIGDDICIFI